MKLTLPDGAPEMLTTALREPRHLVWAGQRLIWREERAGKPGLYTMDLSADAPAPTRLIREVAFPGDMVAVGQDVYWCDFAQKTVSHVTVR